MLVNFFINLFLCRVSTDAWIFIKFKYYLFHYSYVMYAYLRKTWIILSPWWRWSEQASIDSRESQDQRHILPRTRLCCFTYFFTVYDPGNELFMQVARRHSFCVSLSVVLLLQEWTQLVSWGGLYVSNETTPYFPAPVALYASAINSVCLFFKSTYIDLIF